MYEVPHACYIPFSLLVLFSRAGRNVHIHLFLISGPNLKIRFNIITFFLWRCDPTRGHGLLILEVSRSHATTHNSR